MWMPTHVQVTVQRASGLLTKGKNNTNNCFVTIALGKAKFLTSVKEKSGADVIWKEECELPIPDQGNTAEIVLTALHHSSIGGDKFLGQVVIPLNSLDIYEKPKNKWFPLQSKPGKEGKAKERGHLEVTIGFTVKSGSLTNISKKEKHKSSMGALSQVAHSVGGSLISLGSEEKRKRIKKFAKSIGSKMHIKGKKKDDSDDNTSSIGSVGSLNIRSNLGNKFKSRQTLEDADPGVVSDEDDFTFDNLSHKSSASSLSFSASTQSTTNPPPITISPSITKKTVVESNTSPNLRRHTTIGAPMKPPRSDPTQVKPQDEWESKLFGSNKPKTLLKPSNNENRRSWDSSKVASQIDEEPSENADTHTKIDGIPSVAPIKTPEAVKKEDSMFSKFKNNFRKDKIDVVDRPTGNSSERVIIGGETEPITSYNNRVSNELLQKFEGKTREDLILALVDTQSNLEKNKKKLKDLEDYLDELLLKVMETTPRILQNPYVTSCKLAHKKMS